MTVCQKVGAVSFCRQVCWQYAMLTFSKHLIPMAINRSPRGRRDAGGRGTGSADPQQKLIFWVLLIFSTAYVGFILKHLLFVHATEYGVINAGG